MPNVYREVRDDRCHWSGKLQSRHAIPIFAIGRNYIGRFGIRERKIFVARLVYPSEDQSTGVASNILSDNRAIFSRNVLVLELVWFSCSPVRFVLRRSR